MATLNRTENHLFISEGPRDRPYHSMDRRVVSEVATAEVKNGIPEFRPITTEVTQLRPIKLDASASLKRGASESVFAEMKPIGLKPMQSKRYNSESSARKLDHNMNSEFREEMQHQTFSTSHMDTMSSTHTEYSPSSSQTNSLLRQTVVSQGSGSSEPSSPPATLPRTKERVTVEFKRRDLSPGKKMEEKQKVMLIDGKCTCCPFGYHIDLDFLNFCDTVQSGSYLKQLKRVQRDRRKLRKSMEIYLQQQEHKNREQQTPSPDSSSPMDAEEFMYLMDYQESTTNKLLNEIDDSVDATLTSIDRMMETSQGSSTNRVQRKFNTFPKKVGRQVAEELAQYTETFSATLANSGQADSSGSLSSVSTVASDRVVPYGNQSYMSSHHVTNITNETNVTNMTTITSEQLAATMATHLPVEDGAASPQSLTTNISKASLQAIREAMAVSLQRMRELEEQVKAIPILQVRISVLKEEKRLLQLQMQAKERKLNMKSVGVGDDSFLSPQSPTARFEFKVTKSPPPTLPKPKVRMIGVGDRSVFEPYLLQPELEDETMRHTFEKQMLFMDRAQSTVYNEQLQKERKPMTQSVGVGEGNVFDDSLHIHEKELRTVIIGQTASAGKRNVGIECRVSTRDVGVMYSVDSEKPSTRSVGINVDIAPPVTTIDFKGEELRAALQEMLHKSVRSVALQTDLNGEKVDVGVQFAVSAWDVRSIGVGDASIDVEVRNRVARRSIGLDVYPDRMNRAVNTDYGWRLDAMTNTVPMFMDCKATSTEATRSHSAGTMTEEAFRFHQTSQTEQIIFSQLGQIQTVGCNTQRLETCSVGNNTTIRPVVEKGINTTQHWSVQNKGTSTEMETRTIGVSEDTLDSFVCSFQDDDEYRFEEEAVETKTKYYTTVMGQADNKEEKGFEIKREYISDGSVDSSFQTRTVREEEENSKSTLTVAENTEKLKKEMMGVLSSSEAIKGGKKEEEDEDDRNEEILEEKVWRTSGDGQYTVTTVTTKRTFVGTEAENVVRDIKTITGGPEILGSAADIIQKEVEQNNLRQGGMPGLSKSMIASQLGAELDSLHMIRSSSSADGSDSSSGGFDGYSSSKKSYITRSSSTSIGSGGLSSLQTSFSSGSSGISSMDELDHSPTSESIESSNQLVQQTRTYTMSGMMGLNPEMGDSFAAQLENPVTLKSIMKKSASDNGSQMKKGITFASNVVGGESDSSSSANTSEEETEEREEEGLRETTETDSDSDESYDEGSYDSRAGSIIYKCKDDEAIAQGLPGAKMFDQNIRETYELSEEMHKACQVLATYLQDSVSITTKELNAGINVVQQDWFRTSSSKLSSPHQVEDYLSCFNEISKRLLEYVVNMQDSNGNTAMHYAVSHCNFEIVSLLLDTGVCDLNKQNKAGYTPVIMATLTSLQTEQHKEVVQRLLSMGDTNIKAAKDGQTALMFAVRQGRQDMVKMLIDTGADVNAQDYEGSTALMCACEHGFTEIAKLLINTPGCDASIADNDGSTALSIAMDAGHKDVGVLLYAHINFGPGQHSPRM
ncbi:hypothetical protein ACJMK2_040666 [Sinanodonta woodiana]|uniref:Uncharacterized protein n=1 Tax=Sinanodonta woodiana TaxID=1069815 RepID=A0ABD3W5E2_SINWO